jgi:pilus assembly protein CpaC
MPSCVETEVKIVEFNTSDLNTLGLEYGSGVVGAALATIGGGGTGNQATTGSQVSGEQLVVGERQPGLAFRQLTPLGARIRAMIQNNKARVLSNPTIVSDNGTEAKMRVGGRIPIPATTTAGFGGGAFQSVEREEFGIDLTVTANVQGYDGLRERDIIHLKVDTEISDLDYANALTLSSIGTIPAFTDRQMETNVTVGSGDTIVLGGLIKEEERVNVTKIPVLGDIPILGNLFRSKEKSKRDTTVVMVMTPRVVQFEYRE